MKIAKTKSRDDIRENLFIPEVQKTYTKSVYAIQEKEKMTRKESNKMITEQHIADLINDGIIGDLEVEILKAMAVLERATSRMVCMYLNVIGVDEKQQKISSTMRKLFNYKILEKYIFKSNEVDSQVPMYGITLDNIESNQELKDKEVFATRKYANVIMKGYEVEPWSLRESIKNLATTKQVLARNQALLSFAVDISNAKEVEVNKKLSTLKTTIKPQIYLELDVDEIIFLVIRNGQEESDWFTNQLRAYEQYYEDWQPVEESDKKFPPQLVFLGEDDSHILRVVKKLHEQKWTFKNVTPLYTTDLLILNGTDTMNEIFYKISISDEGEDTWEMKKIRYKHIKQ